MNYTNYERQIVEHYGIMLTGWPFSGTVWNPSKIGGQAEVEKLLDALNSEACKWVRLTDEELRARVKVLVSRKEGGRPEHGSVAQIIEAQVEVGGGDLNAGLLLNHWSMGSSGRGGTQMQACFAQSLKCKYEREGGGGTKCGSVAHKNGGRGELDGDLSTLSEFEAMVW
ncbi:hypothetical protein BKA83DRAFT_4123362 [Pisolithus microcarpus]|nr:hypothetical protein BKA83DRAFT_4123362 [Pisolithus microcarpus]